MNLSIVRSFLAGMLTSHFLLGLGLTVLVLGLTQLFPGLEIFGLKAGEAGVVTLCLIWVMIIVYKPRSDSPDKAG